MFTSVTRSVFEVNKLLLLRLTLLVTYGIWLFKYLLFQRNNTDESDLSANPSSYYSILGFKWKRIGLEIPLLLWLLTNFISTLFSQNIRLSIIGSYDRWEGIITVINYVMLLYMFAKLLRKKFQLQWVLWAILLSTSISAIYGILQSVGFDFMHWNRDPSFRVFACINNPVHFCAYVAMTVPLGIAFLLYKEKNGSLAHQHQSEPLYYKVIEFSVFFIIGLVYILNSLFDAGVFPLTWELLIICVSWIVCRFSPSIRFKQILLYLFSLFLAKQFVFKAWLSLTFLQFSLLLAMAWILCVILYSSLGQRYKFLNLFSFSALLIILSASQLLSFSRIEWITFFLCNLVFIILFCAPKYENSIRALLFCSTCLIFYAQVLSYSRATWVGFVIFMPLLYLFATQKFDLSRPKRFFSEIGLSLAISAMFCLLYTFVVYTFSLPFNIVFFTIFLLCFFGLIKTAFHEKPLLLGVPFYRFLCCTAALGILFFMPTTLAIAPALKLLLLPSLFFLAKRLNTVYQHVLEVLFVILIFAHIPTSGHSLIHLFIHISLILMYYFLHLRPSKTLDIRSAHWLFYFLLFFGFFMILPTLPSLISEFHTLLLTTHPASLTGYSALTLLVLLSYVAMAFDTRPFFAIKYRLFLSALLLLLISTLPSLSAHFLQSTSRAQAETSESLGVMKNLKDRTKSLDKALTGSARISMWLSGIPWFKDYPIFGSGLDTIKYMYPVYRRPEYGIKEGGHNFTPDRLHNEYINTLVSKGIVGFFIYYILFLGSWTWIVLKYFPNQRRNPLAIVTFSCVIGANIYLGQVLFNFGVVATLVLFFILIGISLAMAKHPDFLISNDPISGSKGHD